MEKTLLIIIGITGLCTVFSRQYHFVHDRKNMSEARRYCREKYTDLASVESMEDVMILRHMADTNQRENDNFSNIAWIGLYDDVNSWRWSLSNTIFYQDGEMDFRKWSYYEPNNIGSVQLCTKMQDNGFWDDDRCTEHHPAICVNLRGPNAMYVLTPSLTWTDAQRYCRSHHTDLASVRNEAENHRIKEAAGRNFVWIGLYRDSWKWTDGSTSTFRYWNDAAGEPNNYYGPEDCVMANFLNNGLWEDWPCHFQAAFICYTKPVERQVIQLQLKASSSLDLNDPAVMEQILNQFKQKMKDHNLDVNLSWRRRTHGHCFQKQNRKDKETEDSVCDGQN